MYVWGESRTPGGRQTALVPEARASFEGSSEEWRPARIRPRGWCPHLLGDDASSESISSPSLSSPSPSIYSARSKCNLTGLGYSAEIFICSRLEARQRHPIRPGIIAPPRPGLYGHPSLGSSQPEASRPIDPPPPRPSEDAHPETAAVGAGPAFISLELLSSFSQPNRESQGLLFRWGTSQVFSLMTASLPPESSFLPGEDTRTALVLQKEPAGVRSQAGSWAGAGQGGGWRWEAVSGWGRAGQGQRDAKGWEKGRQGFGLGLEWGQGQGLAF